MRDKHGRQRLHGSPSSIMILRTWSMPAYMRYFLSTRETPVTCGHDGTRPQQRPASGSEWIQADQAESKEECEMVASLESPSEMTKVTSPRKGLERRHAREQTAKTQQSVWKNRVVIRLRAGEIATGMRSKAVHSSGICNAPNRPVRAIEPVIPSTLSPRPVAH